MLRARDGSLWIAREEGIFQVKDGVMIDHCGRNGQSYARYHFLMEDERGAIWAAQRDGIMRCMNGEMRLLTAADGLHEQYVFAIVADGSGRFWMDSNRGIYCVDTAELHAVADGLRERVNCAVFEGLHAVKTTDKTDPDEVSGARTADGRIWFRPRRGWS
jgi:ligand-binding sensor domain-containing protein